MICTNKSHPVVLTADIPPQARGWRNDREINRWCRQDSLISVETQKRWRDKIEMDPTIRMFGVEIVPPSMDHDDMGAHTSYPYPVGVCGLTSIDRHNRTAEFSLYIAPDQQKKGYGVSALELLLYHGFQDMGLNRIWGEVFVGNPAMDMFQKLGFKTEGFQRETYWKHGVFIDSHMVSMLAREFKV